MSTTFTVSDAIADTLIRHGVEVTFGQSLPSAVQLALVDRGIRQFAYRTENAGAYMADGYARVSRKAGVVTAQNGPAATLLVAGLAEAMKASTPIVALVQDVPTAFTEKNAFQEFDHFSLFSSCSKWTARLDRAERVYDYLDRAFTAATSGRPGPAVLLLPMDIQIAPVAATHTRSSGLGVAPLDRYMPTAAALDAAADAIAAARSPIVIAGGGAHASDASAEIAVLQEEFGLPVGTTVMGKGITDERHPLSLGVLGYLMGERGVSTMLRDLAEGADLVFLIGTRTNQNGTDTWSLFGKQARFIHLDTDPMEIGRNYEALRLVGDAKSTLRALIEALRQRRFSASAERRRALAARIEAARATFIEANRPFTSSNASPVRPERLMQDLSNMLTSKSIVAADASYASVWIATYLRSTAAGSRFITPRGLAGLGWGLPLAIGARVAAPAADVHCIVGDGGFAHVWSELETAKRTGTKVVVTVLNNGVLGYQKDAEDVRYGRHTAACYFEPVDHAAIARACGCAGVRVERAQDYAAALAHALEIDQPCVIDVITDPKAYPPLTAFTGKLEEVRRRALRATQA